MPCPNSLLARRWPSSFRFWGVRFVALGVLALACASPPPSSDPTYEVLHEGFGIRADLDGWQVFTDPESAPAVLRPAFGNKQGPDDPPLFVAVRDGALFTAFVQPVADADPLQFFKGFELGIAAQGEVTQANRVAGSDDILFAFRLGPRAHAVHSRGLVYAAESRIVNLTLAKQPPFLRA